jgi:hypothetical protein
MSPRVSAGWIFSPVTKIRQCCAQVINVGGLLVLSSDGQVDNEVRRDEGRMTASLVCSIAF